MASMLAVIVFIAVHASVTTEVHIDMKGEIKQGNDISLNCSTNAKDLTFSFQSTADKSQDENIAECVFHNPGCFFLNKRYLAMYNIYLTVNGGILTINNLSSKQYGEYTCFETYPPKNKASVRVEANNTNNFTMDHTATVDTSLVIGIVVIVIVVFIIIVILIICWRRKTTNRVPALTSDPQDVSDVIAGTADPAFHNASSKVQGEENMQSSIEEFGVAHVQNGPDDRETAMKNIGVTISGQETTRQNTNDIDEQHTTPLLGNVSGEINEIGPINDTTMEITSDSMPSEQPYSEIKRLSQASSLSAHNIDGHEGSVDIDNTSQHQRDASEQTIESHPDYDSYDGIEYNQQAVCSPGTTSLYRNGRKLQIIQTENTKHK